PKCADRDRRTELESDDIAWLMHYFATDSGCLDPFWYEFTIQQREMIEAIRSAIVYGGDQSVAASRGEGKTTLFERMLLKYTLTGVVSFSVLFAANGAAAANSLDSIKQAIEDNQNLLADYPEACVPVQALENTPNRAHYQIVSGNRFDTGDLYEKASSKFSWCGQEIIFPNVPGSPCAGAIIATRGLDSAVRGLKKRGKRPQLAGIDDPDTEETTSSEEQAKKLEDRIDKAIGGLGGQQRRIARVMLTTLQNRTCVSAKFTDPKQKSTWKGRRFRYLLTPPARPDLWDEYIQLTATAYETFAIGEGTDEYAREAHRFYLTNRDAMDMGATVANENRFNPQLLPDGSQIEVSSLQRYFNEVARIGQDAVSTEYDNDPPEESGPIESGITAYRVQKQVSGYARKAIPPGCVLLTQGIDCRKIALHWVVRAWRSDGTGFTIDYGVHEVHGTTVGTDEGVDVALRNSITSRVDDFNNAGYMGADGEVLDSVTLVDAGWRTSAIYLTCSELGMNVYPSMGFGKSAGCVKTNFNPNQKRTADVKPGDGWKLVRRKIKGTTADGSYKTVSTWLVEMDADKWKSYEHDRWMTATDKPGTMMLFGESSSIPKRMSFDEKSHFSYAKHITSEVEVEEPIKGVLRRKWKAKSDNNHWLDASYMSCVAASMRGITVMGKSSPAVRERKPRLSLSDMSKAAKQKP
ncbi:MAG TPA: terminase gpA endonuclease subunit, partial [Pirellulales bacterium]|nr:terminase gpA endonuclease subunit [Pirellulales bacterium]